MMRRNINLLHVGEPVFIDKLYRKDYKGDVALTASSSSSMLFFSQTEKTKLMTRFGDEGEVSEAMSLKGTWIYEINFRNPVDRSGDYVYISAKNSSNSHQVKFRISVSLFQTRIIFNLVISIPTCLP